jgi:cell division transport system permease protein
MQEVGNGIRRNFSIFISVVLVTLISFTFVGGGALMQMQIAQSKGQWYDRVEVSVWMCPNGVSDYSNCAAGTEATPANIDDLVNFLNTNLADQIESIYVEPKEEVFQELEKQYPGGIVEGQQLTAEDMQVVLRIKLVQPENYQVLAEVLSGRPGVEQVQDQRALFEPTFNLLNVLTVFSMIIAVIMLIAALLLISTTIRLSAETRKDQTQIMRLSGASNWFIQLPFLLEGALAAVFGALMSIGVLAAIIHFFIQGYLPARIKWMEFIALPDLLIVGPILLAAAIILAASASILSLRKYTKI